MNDITLLVNDNTPARLWCPLADVPPAVWQDAIRAAAPLLELPDLADEVALDALLALTLGEGQFGADHWRLSRAKTWYYRLKPLLPRPVIRLLRRVYHAGPGATPLGWPVEGRYVRFQWAVMRHVLLALDCTAMPFVRFWPDAARCALVLTHDIETADGQDVVREVAALEERYGFRSSFNFVPERYRVDTTLLAELRTRGFEIGVHGLTHDGKLFASHAEFMRRAARINEYLAAWDAVGFRAPCTLRHPAWMQALAIDYDLSFFDTDPHEPIPGGVMAIWPFQMGHFVELPYTLVQDHTLTTILKHTTPQVWLDKLAFIARYHGMALLNTHPDYLRDRVTWAVYEAFLAALNERRRDFWHALPHEVAAWWCARSDGPPDSAAVGAVILTETSLRLR